MASARGQGNLEFTDILLFIINFVRYHKVGIQA